MPKPSAQVTAAEISRMAGVTRATVSNWRRRHEDFPEPTDGTDSSPLYDVRAVRAWLEARGQVSAASATEELRTVLRLHSGDGSAGARALPLVLTAARLEKDEISDLAERPDKELASHAGKAVAGLADVAPGADTVRYDPQDAELLRAVLRCVRDDGSGSALELLADRELDDSGAVGAYPTPAELADLMAQLLAPPSGPYPASVLDPACGGGTTLVAAARHGATSLYGQDMVPVQAQRSAVALALAAPSARVTVRDGDSLRGDAFTDLTVDGVLCTPPYGDRDWGHDELAYDPRWAYGLPPRVESELAWLQHVLWHLAPGAFAVLLLPPGDAARPSGRRVRAELLRGGVLRAVIALPPGSGVPLHIGLHLWVLQRPQAGGTDGPDSVLFVDTLDERTEGVQRVVTGRTARRVTDTARQVRRDGDWERLRETTLTQWRTFADAPAAFASVPGTAHAVPVIDLLDDVTDLTPARHVRTAAPTAKPAEVARQVGGLHDRLSESIEALGASTAVNGWHAAGDEPRSWRTATVSDLARGAALTLHRAATVGSRGGSGGQDGELPEDYSDRAVLTGRDLAGGTPASGEAETLQLAATVLLEPGDVLLPGVLGGHARTPARVVEEGDAGCLLGPHLHLFRPDFERLDSWFLAGFLSTDENLSSASTGSTTVHLSPRRLRVPLLPPDEQRRYGDAFRRLHELRTTAHRAAQTAAEAAGLATLGLTSGALLPPDGESA